MGREVIEFKRGNRVRSISLGECGRVKTIYSDKIILVGFDDDKEYEYLNDGRRCEKTEFIDLELIESILEEQPNLDDRVLVWDKGDVNKHKRHFKKFGDNGKVVVFANGFSSFTATEEDEFEYDYYELVRVWK